jgi:hypothetical protein
MSEMNWLDAWPLLLILAIGIGIGRWIERRRTRKRDPWTGEMSAPSIAQK